ncbi:RNA ligase [Pseudomonas phage PspYZU05]|uniref:RNA ligase (ATP) n=1 Tax=Pseudomonas phage PspYZU05 TaxID=1983556 RepID=A0A2U7NJK2_9CAUD|nr:RNA ligase [Pseudomonas phage PspYZU05]ASD52094.1 RNA ligase [Pseudomonas phage PspYZU05]
MKPIEETDMLNFTKYSSLENHYQCKVINQIFEEGHAEKDILYVAREKIHGTNFSVIFDGISYTYAKRTGIIEEGERFFDHMIIDIMYKERFNKILSTAQHLQIFGEFAGGSIQKNMEYGDKDFYVFDILVTDPHSGIKFYMTDHEMVNFCNKFGLKTAPLLGYGTFEELVNWPNNFNTLIPKYNSVCENMCISEANNVEWGKQPEVDVVDFISEGFVLKPVEPRFFIRGYGRIAIKSKNKFFSEKTSLPKVIVRKEMSEKDAKLLETLSTYCATPRILNVISKIGEITKADFSKVLKLYVEDIKEESTREGVVFTDADDVSLLIKGLYTVATTSLREYWLTM